MRTIEADDVPLNKRRGFRFSLRSLQLAVLLAAVGGVLVGPMLQNSQALGQEALERLRTLQQRIINAADKAKSSVVRVVWRYRKFNRDLDDCASGVILSPDGYIATYLYMSHDPPVSRYHTHIPAGTSVSVTLADGRQVPGVAVGSYSSQKHLCFDLVKITENGVWPCAELRHTGAPKAGETCLALGFAREPGIRPGRALEREARVRIGHLIPWGVSGMLRSSCVIDGLDDRGGGLFDLDGGLIGIHLFNPFADYKALTELTTCHLEISVVEQNWRSLADQKSTAGESMPGQATPTSEALRNATVQTVPSPDAPELAKTASKAQEVSVALTTRRDVLLGCSGTIITPDGYIATCAHHQLPRGASTTVYFSDGRTARATFLGRDDVLDIGLAKIGAPGPWPFAPLGRTADVKAGDPCIIAGYPNHLRKQGKVQLVVGGARIADTRYAPTETLSFCQVSDGDSGGGLFDRKGRLIAVHCGYVTPHVLAHAGADGFAALWKSLVDGPALSDSFVFDESLAAAAMGKAVQRFSPIACEVFGDGKRCALGTIITTDGFVLTKASELFGTISCRLATGRELPADVHGVAHQHDLALLKIDVTGLPQINWDERDEIPVGTLVAALRGVEPPAIGIVSTSRHEVSSAIGYLPIGKVSGADGGIRVEEVEGWWNSVVEDVQSRRQLEKPEPPVRVGDVILSIEGRPVPTVQAFEQLVTRRDDGPGWEVPFVIGGDPICVTLRRNEKERRLRFPLLSSNWDPRLKTNRRSCSFPAVFDTDVRLTKGLCGGPLVDCEGRVVGITIAVPEGVLADSPVATRVYAVPAALARAVANVMLAIQQINAYAPTVRYGHRTHAFDRHVVDPIQRAGVQVTRRHGALYDSFTAYPAPSSYGRLIGLWKSWGDDHSA